MIFVDTGAFIGRFVERDQHHEDAQHYWQLLEEDPRPCCTSNFVLDETITLLARRTTYPFAAERAHTLYDSKILTILRPGWEEEQRALSYFQKFADQNVSFTDCVSFALMEKYGIAHVFSFDRHFQLAGFVVEP